jgi:hypothetical protein
MGQYVDVNNAAHGFLRAIDGKITRFNAPGAGTGAGQGTYPMTNNREGAISGFYVDANNVYHGFLRNTLDADHRSVGDNSHEILRSLRNFERNGDVTPVTGARLSRSLRNPPKEPETL